MILLIFSIGTHYATSLSIGGHAGTLTLSDNYDAGLHVTTGMEFLSKSGLGFTFNTGIMNAKSKEATREDLTIIPLKLGARYYLNPREKISLYLGANAGLYLLSDGYDSSVFGWGSEAGFRMKIDPKTQVFIGVKTHSFNDDKTNQDFSAFATNFGIQLKMGDSKYTRKKGKRMERDLKGYKKKPGKRKKKGPMNAI